MDETTNDTNNEAEPRKMRTITLTGRAPIRIAEDEWPMIARASCRPGSMRNGTPVPDYETDCYMLHVRQHADGRVIVYGVIDAATAWTRTEDWRGGELLAPPNRSNHPEDGLVVDSADVVSAIRRVGGVRFPDSVMRECIANLPAEEI